MSRHKMEECGTLHYKEQQDFLHCIQQDTHTRARARTPRAAPTQPSRGSTSPPPPALEDLPASCCQSWGETGFVGFVKPTDKTPLETAGLQQHKPQALSTLPHRQSVSYIARLYRCTMHYRTAIEQEMKLGDRYLAEENESVWSSLSTYKDH